MSKRKYKRGSQIKTIGQFATSKSAWFIVKYGDREKTTHRGWLESMQYRCLLNTIKYKRLFVAREIK